MSHNGSPDRGCQMGGIRSTVGKGELLVIPTATRGSRFIMLKTS